MKATRERWLTIRMSPEEKEKIAALAQLNSLTLSGLTRRLFTLAAILSRGQLQKIPDVSALEPENPGKK